MTQKDNLTNEQLNKRFANSFALVNYAISLAKVRLQRGEGLDSNAANDVMEMLTNDHDQLDSIDEEEEEITK